MKTKKEYEKEFNERGYKLWSVREVNGVKPSEYCISSVETTKHVATISIKNGKIGFNGEKFTDLDSLFNAIEKYNGGLYFDPDTYCPNYNPKFVREMRMHQTLEKCGFKNALLDGYAKPDEFVNNGVLGATFGKVYNASILYIGNDSMVDLYKDEWDDETSAKSIKAMLTAVYAANVAKLVGHLNDMGEIDKIGDIEIKTFDPKTLTLKTTNGKEGIIKLLEETLEKLKK